MEPVRRTFLDWDVLAQTLPRLLTEGLRNTLVIAFLSSLVGVTIGLGMAALLLSRRWWLRLPVRTYVETFRGIPAIVTVMLIGIGLPAAGLRPFGREPYGYAVLAIGVISGAYLAEVFQSGVRSVDPAQIQAVRVDGGTRTQAFRLVVVPQTIRYVLPTMAGQFVKDVKESSLVYVLGLGVGQRELFFIAQEEGIRAYNSSPLVAAAICYLVITVPLSYLVGRVMPRHTDRPYPSARRHRMPRTAPIAAGVMQ